MLRRFVFAAMILAVIQVADADDRLSPEQLDFFESRIRPVLVRECYSCHSTQVGATKGGLWLDTRDGVLLGGDTGPAIVPGKLDDSLLWNAINHVDFSMPPRKKLSAEIIADFKTWIEMGAPDPRVRLAKTVQSEITSEAIETGRKFWSFQPPAAPPVPAVDSDWPITDIDRFIYRGLAERQLEPNPDTDALTLLRRLTFGITGLPPTVEQIERFPQRWEADPQAALDEVVDRLLASEPFGEKWGRHWLDVARYAESTGREQNVTFPHAWRYRDYVIDSFNADKPYDRFVQEQLAGDLLPVATDEQWAENLVATGFLALGPKTLTEQNARQFDLDLIDEQIDVTTRVMLGVSVACARCHDHKFDPIPQTDYYAVAGIFQNMTTHYGTVNNLQNRRPSNLLVLPVDDLLPGDVTLTPDQLGSLRERLAEKRDEQRQALQQRRMARSGEMSDRDQQRQVLNAFRISAEIGVLEDQLNRYNDDGTPNAYCMGVQETSSSRDARLLERGEFDKPAQEVPRGFPQVLCYQPPDISPDVSGRLEFARWVGSAENPLTARVMVNRIWLQLFGDGLVRTPENFGFSGERPTHPELLDYLAVGFVEQGWSIKQLVRELVRSRVYRTSSQYTEASFQADPENRTQWRFEPRRLDAEWLRDAMLAASGKLDLQRPPGSVVAAAPTSLIRDGNLIDLSGAGMSSMRPGTSSGSYRKRMSELRRLRDRVQSIDQPSEYRSVYLPIVRDHLPRSLEAFDFAEPTMVVGRRDTSNTPDQGLYFLNNEFVIQQSDALARRLIGELDDASDQIQQAFRLIYGRPATAGELAATSRFYRQFALTDSDPPSRGVAFRGKRRPSGGRPNQKPDGLASLSAVCQALFASAEFRVLN